MLSIGSVRSALSNGRGSPKPRYLPGGLSEAALSTVPVCDLGLRGVMAIFVNAKNTQTTALRVRTGLTEHTCKGLGPVEAPTPRYTHDCARIFPFLAMLATSSAPVH